MRKRSKFTEVIDNIDNAWSELRKHPKKRTTGIDDVSIETFRKNETENLNSLKGRLRSGSFVFSALKPVYINDRTREILIPCVEDRIVSKAILNVITPKFAKYSTSCSYCPILHKRKDSDSLAGVSKAALKIQKLIRDGYIYVFETDIKKFFNNVNKKKILQLIRKEIPDRNVMSLIKRIIHFHVQETGNSILERPEEIGLAQGSSLSPLLANIYLHDFDKQIEGLCDVVMVRYVDDLVIHCKSSARAHEVYKFVDEKIRTLGLEIHKINTPNEKGDIKTSVLNVWRSPLFFLGLQFDGDVIRIPKKKRDKKIIEVRKILYGKGNLLMKMQIIRSRLKSFIRQYQEDHYSAGRDIETLIFQVKTLLEKYYRIAYVAAFGVQPFARNTNPNAIKKFFKFIGLDMDDLKSPPKKKIISRVKQ